MKRAIHTKLLLLISLSILFGHSAFGQADIDNTPPNVQHVCVGHEVTYTMYGFAESTIEWHVKEFAVLDNPIGSVVLPSTPIIRDNYVEGQFKYTWSIPGIYTLQIKEISSTCESTLGDIELTVNVHDIPVISTPIIQSSIPACSGQKADVTVNATGSSLAGVTLQYRLTGEGIDSPSFQSGNVFSNIAQAGNTYTVDVRYVVTGSDPLVVVKGSDVSETKDVVEDLDNTAPVFANNLPSSPLNINSDLGKCSAVVTYNNPIVEDNCSFVGAITDFTFIGKFNGHSYYLSDVAKKPKEANKAAFDIGGHLVTIETALENDFLKDNQTLKDNVPEGIWIGLNDTLIQKDFKWVTGEVLGFENWNGVPSDDSGAEDWVEMYINWPGYEGLWNDNSITQSKKYVVEFDGPRFNQTQGLSSGSAFPVGTTANTFEILNDDGTGTGITTSFDVIVTDNQEPVLADVTSKSKTVCPLDGDEANVPQTAVVTGLNLTSDSYSDNCTDDSNLLIQYKIVLSDNTVVFDFGEKATGAVSTSDPSGYAFKEGTTTVSYKITDEATNDSEIKSFTVTVNHKPNPGQIEF